MFERINVIKSHILDSHDIDYVYKKKVDKNNSNISLHVARILVL